ncbi:MAG: ubiquinol-cytochrome C chaperone family protein [Alphaproteobacteria bacterium PRO2]|nr:ubiquinol-cytochrome C chaperone family protein [Alphaproteobacteria bacterium PRO2]
MLAFLKKKTPHADPAKRAYAQILQHIRAPVFYTTYGVPDSFDGRFDLLLVHLFIVINRLAGEGEQAREFNQALFDVTFADMDQTLREMGIGDMGVPKHQRRMMKGFNGRMHGYDEALKQGEGAFVIALRRNLYGTLEDSEVPDIQKIMRYIRESMAVMAKKPVPEILNGEVAFAGV